MRFPKVAVVSLLGCVLSTPTLAGDDESIAVTFDFRVNVIKERKEGFSPVTPKPSVDKDLEPGKEALIPNELGKRRYCPEGSDIVRKTPKKYSIYEGVCK
jgi:hypothetical protein